MVKLAQAFVEQVARRCSVAVTVLAALTVTPSSCLRAKMIPFEHALMVSVATAAVTVAYSSTEPYAALLVLLVPNRGGLPWQSRHSPTW
ncbi:arabinofuranosyltransferase [Mycobacterium sp.]|uniref:arabinofuranosyltransferase n=1 Tax=Mycobacterium sp. TaxID=1785 RepID=UPI003F963DBC